jgi:hypothetical protein
MTEQSSEAAEAAVKRGNKEPAEARPDFPNNAGIIYPSRVMDAYPARDLIAFFPDF